MVLPHPPLLLQHPGLELHGPVQTDQPSVVGSAGHGAGVVEDFNGLREVLETEIISNHFCIFSLADKFENTFVSGQSLRPLNGCLR